MRCDVASHKLGFRSERLWPNTTSTFPDAFQSNESCGCLTVSSWTPTSVPFSWEGPGQENPAQRNTPFVQEECEGQVTVTDPRHPLFDKTFKLAGMARLPGHVKHCQVEIRPGQYGYIPVSSTNLSTAPFRAETLLTAESVQDLVAMFQTLPGARRAKHATKGKSRGVGTAKRKRKKRGS